MDQIGSAGDQMHVAEEDPTYSEAGMEPLEEPHSQGMSTAPPEPSQYNHNIILTSILKLI